VDLFEPAKRSIVILMQNDSLPRFLKSNSYLKLMKDKEAGNDGPASSWKHLQAFLLIFSGEPAEERQGLHRSSNTGGGVSNFSGQSAWRCWFCGL